MKGTAIARVGVLGAGRLGRALAARLRERASVAVSDVDPRKGKQAAKQLSVTFCSESELVAFADLVVLCVPADAVVPLLRGTAAARQPSPPLFANTATSVETGSLVHVLGPEGVRVVGLKPIGQFRAIASGVRTTFVSANADPAELRALAALFEPIGDVVTGDERAVEVLNRTATRLALEFCFAFEDAVAPLASNQQWVRSALRSVAAGTVLDHPAEPGNGYIRGILDDMAAGSRHASTIGGES